METKLQTSFIPKKPIVEERDYDSGISLFLLISIILFIVALATAGGIWVWKNTLTKQIQENKAQLESVRASYEEGTINSLIRLDDRIKEAKTLLDNHIAVSPIFMMMEQNILQKVRLKSLKFTYSPDKKIKIELAGIARSYEVLSKQAEAFGVVAVSTGKISQPVISDFSLTQDGNVTFNFNTMVDQKLVSYPQMIKDKTPTTETQ